jgi:Co/Zn/Cd efflux system component
VVALNLGYFGIEFAVATHIGSVSLFADSIDFIEDATVNALILLGLGWSARSRAKLGMALSAVLLIPAIATLWTAWLHWGSGQVPAPLPLAATGAGALIVNLSCALMLARIRHAHGSLTRAAFLSARNDAIANVAIMGAGVLTALKASAWPDLIVGLGILLMNLDAAREVFEAARAEHGVTQDDP